MFSSFPKGESDRQTLIVIDVLNALFKLDLSSGELISNFGFLESVDFFIRKFAHFIEYFVLGVLSFLSLRDVRFFFKRQRVAQSALAILFCMLYAASDEIHQLFVSGRNGSVKDVLIDTLGSAFSVLICLGVVWIVKKHRRKNCL